MGCFSSKEAVYEAKHGQAAKTGREQGSASGPNPPAYLLEAGPQSILLGANAGILTPSSVTNQNKYAIPNSGPRNAAGQGPTGSFIALGAGGGSITGINRRTPVGLKSGAHVSADLNAIVDDQGTINALVSRQLSVMSHYSVKSEAGSVILQPEVAHGPNALGFTLHKLIGRGGFGNVYLGEWEGRKVAVKVVTGNNNETASDQVGAARGKGIVQEGCPVAVELRVRAGVSRGIVFARRPPTSAQSAGFHHREALMTANVVYREQQWDVFRRSGQPYSTPTLT